MSWIVGWYVVAAGFCVWNKTNLPWFVWAWPAVGYMVGYVISVVLNLMGRFHGSKNTVSEDKQAERRRIS